MKSKIFRVCSTAIFLLLTCQFANAAGVVVIANPDVSVTADDVRDIFLGEKQFAGSIKLIVIDNAAMQSAFLSQIMNMDAAKYNGIWTKKSFRDGLTPPAVKSGDAEVIEFIKRTPGSIGYASRAPSGVKVIQ
jgi:ABC-type phosphate transport system substrate-binding protein